MGGQVKAVLAVDDPRHGTFNGYGNLGCRCDRCRAVATVRLREWRQAARDRTPPVHGYSGYGNWGCRCDVCKAGWAAAARRRRVERGHGGV